MTDKNDLFKYFKEFTIYFIWNRIRTEDPDPVAQRVDNAVQRISVTKTFCAIQRIEIYPVGSLIHPSINRSLVCKE